MSERTERKRAREAEWRMNHREQTRQYAREYYAANKAARRHPNWAKRWHDQVAFAKANADPTLWQVPWTEAEHLVALREDMTIFQKAIALRRTIPSVQSHLRRSRPRNH